jgi:sec-independent protein translocase protein TatA
MLGATEILIIGGIVFILFGATAIPKLAKSLGQAKKEFQKGISDQEEDASRSQEEKEKTEEEHKE